MTIQHRIIPCLKHHVSNLFRKSLRYRLRNPVYKKSSKPSKTMVKVRSIWEIIRSSDNPRVINEDLRDLAHDELLMDEEESPLPHPPGSACSNQSCALHYPDIDNIEERLVEEEAHILHNS